MQQPFIVVVWFAQSDSSLFTSLFSYFLFFSGYFVVIPPHPILFAAAVAFMEALSYILSDYAGLRALGGLCKDILNLKVLLKALFKLVCKIKVECYKVCAA